MVLAIPSSLDTRAVLCSGYCESCQYECRQDASTEEDVSVTSVVMPEFESKQMNLGDHIGIIMGPNAVIKARQLHFNQGNNISDHH